MSVATGGAAPKRSKANLLFDRQWLVTLAPSLKSASSLDYGNTLRGAALLRVTFDIKKDCKPDGNTCNVVIYNMSQDNRRLVQRGWAIVVQAGYPGNVKTIWAGQVGKGIASKNPDLDTSQRAATKQEGADVSFALESVEGKGPLDYGHISANYRKGTPMSVVFDDIKRAVLASNATTSFGLTLGSIPSTLPWGGDVQRGLVLDCTCAHALSQILHPIGYEWFVDNNALQVVAKTDYTKDGIPYISSETGLLGVPSLEDNGVLTVTCTLDPSLAPGKLIELRSAVDPSFNGYFRVRRCQQKGDSHGETWQSELECVAWGSNPNNPLITPSVLV